MIVRRSVLLLIAAVLVAMSGSGVAEPDKPAKPADPAKPAENTKPEIRKNAHALLVGVTYYEHLAESHHLEGPGNDVVMMAKILTEKFNFDPANITTLSEEQGKAKGKDFYPTKGNIKREWERLGKIAKKGDYIVICMGGHGSQQPEDRAAKAKILGGEEKLSDPEPDGMDEIFLPRDVGKWDGGSGTVANAIIDDEVANWIKPIREKGASMWIVFDSCHSGTMTRGAPSDKEKTRDADPVKDLGVPKERIEKAEADAQEREKKEREKRGGEKSRGAEPPASPVKLAEAGGIVAIYAAQSSEVTLEREMPPGGKGGKVYGLLSYTIASVLTEASEKSKKPITYNELARRVQAQYVAWGRSFPTPLIEGKDRDREVLGDNKWPGRSSMQLAIKADGLKVNAGTVHGLTVDSILLVKPPAGKGDDELGYLKVKEVRPFDCDVEPCDKEGKTIEKTFEAACVCEKYLIAPGDQRLKVAVDPTDEKGRKMPPDMEKMLNEALQAAAKESPIINPVEKLKDADWLIRQWSKADDKIILVPGAGWSVGRDNTDSIAFGPKPVKAKKDAFVWLLGSLEAINRAETVKKMAAGGGSEGSDSGVKVKVELIRYKSRNKEDIKNPMPVSWESSDVPVYPNDLLAVKLTNPNRFKIDVTILFVSSKCGIDCLFPQKGENINRLDPNASLIVPGPSEKPPFFTVNSKTVGMEQLVILAVKASGQPVDFSVLEQKDLDFTKERAKPEPLDKKELASPLGNLLRAGAFGDTKSRGLSREEVDDYATMMIPLRTRQEKRPEEKK